jgi:hypothetical protein
MRPLILPRADPNLYRYVGNSPTNATDPTGLFTKSPIDYLPALSGSGFGRGVARDLAILCIRGSAAR